jgi:OOP family OmpA-OmpF porin
MTFSRVSGLLGLLALSIIASPTATAQDSGWYLGANVGQSKAKIDDVRIINGLVGGGFTTTSITDRNSDTGFKVFGGYQFNRYFSFEAGYFDLGKFGFTALTLPTGSLTGDIKLKGINFDAVVSLPLSERFSLFGRVGANQAEAKDTFSGTGMVNVLNPNPTAREVNLKFGGGLQLDFTKSFGMRAEIERYRINDAVGNKGDIDLVSVGLLIKFGRKAPAPAPQAYVPESPVVPPPTLVLRETPVMVVVPVPTPTQRYCTILDIQFEVDRDEIQREEKERLAVVGTFLNKYPATTAVIEGHTDNVGTPEHNQKLSQNRAESVVSYLVNNLHIAPPRLTAVGYGDTRPVADNRTEEGKRQNRRIGAVIACAEDVEGLSVAPARMTMAMLIEFDQNKAEIRPQYHEELRKVANFMTVNPTVTATVEGHTGNTLGTPEAAMEMSQRRAENVVNYLVDKLGIQRSRLSAEGFGRERRFAYNTSVEGKQENRRVNIIINYPKKRQN